MMCPYNRKTETQTLQYTNDITDDGFVKTCTQVSKFDFGMMECEKENCGAWRNGSCRYAALSIEKQETEQI